METKRAGESLPQAYSRYVSDTEEGKLLLRAYKAAPAAPKQAPQDLVPRRQPATGPAAAEMDRAVEEFMRANKKLTRAQAYDRVFNDNRELRARVKAEELAKRSA